MGNHLFVIFAVLDVSFGVNSCLQSKPQFFLHLYADCNELKLSSDTHVSETGTDRMKAGWVLIV